MELEQPLINIGLLGHVANGKSSLVRAVTGEKTSRGDSRCMQKGESREMTIQIGYSNAKIYQCGNCPKPDCYSSIEGSKKQVPICDNCGTNDNMTLVQYVSFVDAPGHRQLMRNMISGATVMDAAILVIDSSNLQLQIQTLEHLAAAEIIGINHYIAVAQNKIDLLRDKDDCKEKLVQNYEQIKAVTKGTGADLSHTPIIPTCFSPARHINLKLLLQHLVERAKPNPHPAYKQYPMFIHCVRSFDVNKPAEAKNLVGGVIGGTIMTGILRIGDTLEIRPGYRNENGEYCPLYTKVTSLYTGNVALKEARPGGLIGIGTTLDPALTRSDAMVGMCAGYPNQLPESTTRLELDVKLLKVGIGHEKELQKKVGVIKDGQVVQLGIGSASVLSKLTERMCKIGDQLVPFVQGMKPLTNTKKKKRTTKCVYIFETSYPVCPVPGQSIPISKVIDNAWTIVGKATLHGSAIAVAEPPTVPIFTPYQELLEQMLTDTASIPKLDGKVVIQPPKLVKDGGAKLIWTNFADICQVLHRELEQIQAFFTEELATRTSINGKEQLVIHGKNRYQSSHIQSILVKYINTFVNCTSCNSVHTTLSKAIGNKYTQLLCENCGAEYLR